MDKQTIENIIREYLYARDEIITGYLFGSFVTSGKYNDIDIAIYLRGDSDYKDLRKFPFGYESEVLGNLNLLLKTDNVDLIVLNDASLSISKQVYNTGKLLFEKDKYLRIHIENTVRKEYIDTQYLRDVRSYYLKKRLNVR